MGNPCCYSSDMASSEVREVVLNGGAPWGFRLQGGNEFRAPLRIAKVSCYDPCLKFECQRGGAKKSVADRTYFRNATDAYFKRGSLSSL